ncbi:MAG: hypothetical protein M3O86_05815 [Actinomycetota bacterium]|nr:hypothetical protein [Actinomycetota bacterium]
MSDAAVATHCASVVAWVTSAGCRMWSPVAPGAPLLVTTGSTRKRYGEAHGLGWS